MAKAEKPNPEWSIVEFFGWFEKFTEKSTLSNSWRYKGSYLNDSEAICLFKEIIQRCVLLEKEIREQSKNNASSDAPGEVHKTEKSADSDNESKYNFSAASQLEKQLVEQKTELERLCQTVGERDRQLRTKETEITTLQEKLRLTEQKFESVQTELASLRDSFDKPETWTERFKSLIPDFLKFGQERINELKNKVRETEKQANEYYNQHQKFIQSEYNPLVRKFNTCQSQLEADKQKCSSERKSLHAKIKELEDTNNNQLAEIARLAEKKQAESVGDYEKREGYQVITDYKAFCTQQSLDVITEDVYDYLRQRKEEWKDVSRRDLFIAQTKAILSKALLMNVYKEQIRRLGNQQFLLEFTVFFESHGKNLLYQLDLSEELAKQLEKTAKKGFDLVNQLVQITPTCHLVIADNGDEFNSEEHELAAGCPEDGIVEFTVVPGVLSGHRFLMKPIVYTVPYDPVRDKA